MSAKMNKENIIATKCEEHTIRITRARAKALGTSKGISVPPSKPTIKQDRNCVLPKKSKRPATIENKSSVNATAGLQHKKRAVLSDVTNVKLKCESSYMKYINPTKLQPNKRINQCPKKKNARQVSSLPPKSAMDNMILKASQISKTMTLEEEEEIDTVCCKFGASGFDIKDIDSKHKDPLMCSMYVSDIYNIFHAIQCERRPSADFMETVQRDITQSMRGVLVDWLVEVSEEYKLVPDTLYLTVNLIDRFLSENYIEKQRLQLLGVTCMLIASKYGEICAPHVEELCFITDNTYTKNEVVKMEHRVLNFLQFQLSVPTTKTFLRRFVLAAQACYEVPCAELEFLANYLTELTLIDYNFIKFLPSLVAASAIFLARWTLHQPCHPWNPTLEHYTKYKAPELKTSVLAMQDLQMNMNRCSLISIREKYKQEKFKCVANLTPMKQVDSLF